MKRSFLFSCALFLLLGGAGFAQTPGHLTVTVSAVAQADMPAGPVSGAKIIVVHWTHALHPTVIQDKMATTGQMGTATLDLPPGTYDVFVSASGLAPYAFRSDVESGGNATVAVKMKRAETHFRPTE
jgi:hypothetical protein